MILRDISTMTREQANEVLTLWKLGIESYPRRVIDMALYVCGDLDEKP